jgi:predicted Zn-ribbon and HTH transcriptional regulator
LAVAEVVGRIARIQVTGEPATSDVAEAVAEAVAVENYCRNVCPIRGLLRLIARQRLLLVLHCPRCRACGHHFGKDRRDPYLQWLLLLLGWRGRGCLAQDIHFLALAKEYVDYLTQDTRLLASAQEYTGSLFQDIHFLVYAKEYAMIESSAAQKVEEGMQQILDQGQGLVGLAAPMRTVQ